MLEKSIKKILQIYHNFTSLSGYIMNAKIKMNLYVIFTKPANFHTTDIKCVTILVIQGVFDYLVYFLKGRLKIKCFIPNF